MSEIIEEKEIEIRNATLKDMCCNYGYELLIGKTKGDIINRKGMHVVHEDLENAFKGLDIFIAQIDGAFESWANNQTTLEKLEENETLEKYKVLAFKFSGVEENKSIVFTGEKEVSTGTISFSTPKIKLQSAYLYIAELTDRIEEALKEVELYMEGKTAPQYEQQAMDFLDDVDVEFEEAKVG